MPWGRASCRLFIPTRHREKGQTMTADIGEVAPNFSLPSANNETIGLAQFRGQKHVILSFHVFNFTSG
jgi:AhpC/TSA family